MFCTDFWHRWRPPKFVRERSEEENTRIRDKYHILVDGEDIPAPIENFTVCKSLCLPLFLFLFVQDMKVPAVLVKFLKSKRITTPTPIQLQGIPTA